MGFKSEVRVHPSGEWATNAVVWPDYDSAMSAGHDLMSRWMLVIDVRVIEVSDEPNRPTWDEYVSQHGYPPRSVQL